MAAVVPKLDNYRSRHGMFPHSLNEVGITGHPSLLSGSHGYTADSNYFRFEYWDEAGMMGGWYFDSLNRKWTYFD